MLNSIVALIASVVVTFVCPAHFLAAVFACSFCAASFAAVAGCVAATAA